MLCCVEDVTLRVLKLQQVVDRDLTTSAPATSATTTLITTVAMAISDSSHIFLTTTNCLPLAIILAIAAGVFLLLTLIVSLTFAIYFCWRCRTTNKVIMFHFMQIIDWLFP